MFTKTSFYKISNLKNQYLVFQDPEVREVIAQENIKIISCKDLRDLQRKHK